MVVRHHLDLEALTPIREEHGPYLKTNMFDCFLRAGQWASASRPCSRRRLPLSFTVVPMYLSTGFAHDHVFQGFPRLEPCLLGAKSSRAGH